MKAILVIDMPECCGKCPCYHEGYGHCSINFRFVDDEMQIPSWCPLKPMLERKEVDYSKELDYADGYFAEGWNACLEEIEKPKTKSDLSTDEGWWRDYELYEMQND